MVLGFPLASVSIQRPSDGIGRKRSWERSWTMVWTQHSCWCYQVCERILTHIHLAHGVFEFRALVHAFPKAGLGVSVAADSVIYQSDVYAASHNPIGSPKRHTRKSWGNRGVLVLIGIRLGIGGVNPVYYEAIKASPSQRALHRVRCYMVTLMLTFPRLSGNLHLASVCWNRGWSPILLVLLRRFSGRQPLLSRSSSRPTHYPTTATTWRV